MLPAAEAAEAHADKAATEQACQHTCPVSFEVPCRMLSKVPSLKSTGPAIRHAKLLLELPAGAPAMKGVQHLVALSQGAMQLIMLSALLALPQ